MKKITIILLGFIALLAVSCDKDDHLAPDKSKYVYDIPQTDLPVDAIVGAYYRRKRQMCIRDRYIDYKL